MSIIHMDTEVVYEHARQMMYTASDILKKVDTLRLQVARLRIAWKSPQADHFFSEWDGLFHRLNNLAVELDHLANRVMREADEWISTDRTQSAYFQEVRPALSFNDVERIVAASILASTLRWSEKRWNSIIFTGPNPLRKALDIKPMTRVIRPWTLAKGMATVGMVESLRAGVKEGIRSFLEYAHEDVARAVSAATVDGAFKTVLSAVGKAGIPLALGAIMSTVGAPVLVSGAVVLVGSVVGQTVYSKFLEEPVWNLWKKSTIRLRVIEEGKRAIDWVSNRAQALVDQMIVQPAKKVQRAFSYFIRNLTQTPLSAPST